MGAGDLRHRRFSHTQGGLQRGACRLREKPCPHALHARYCSSSDPFPTIVREFQKIIGEEARAQFEEFEKTLPDAVIACVGGGSNAIGLFTDFIAHESVELIGVEPAGMGLQSGKHGVTLGSGTEGIFFGAGARTCKPADGQINESYSIPAGLDFPSVGPEHAYLQSIGRARYENATDNEALAAFMELSLKEGIIPALESSHALAYALRLIRSNPERPMKLIVNLSGRGDKDIFQVARRFEDDGLLEDGRLTAASLTKLQARLVPEPVPNKGSK